MKQVKYINRILLVISSLEVGGAQRVMTIMANYWAERGEDITLLTLTEIGNDFFYLNPYVKRVGLELLFPTSGFISAIRANILRIKAIRKVIFDVQPDVIVSFMDKTNIMTLLAAKGTGVPVIVSERIDPGQSSIGVEWSFFRRNIYKYAESIVVQTDSIAAWVIENIGVKATVIPNPVIINKGMVRNSERLCYKNNIVAIGRLVFQKGFDLLLRAFAIIAPLYPQWGLTISGNGEMKDELVRLSYDLGIQQEVCFLGTVVNPWEILKNADIFILPSRFEGFPNVLLEAMVQGLPAISFSCPSGPAEIITDNYNGILVTPENVEELALAIERLILQPEERLRLGENARNITNVYSLDRVMAMWDKTIINAKNKSLNRH